MTEQKQSEKGTLVLALLAGLSANGSFIAVFSSPVPFSIFPLIALVLSVYCLHQRYMHHAMPQGTPMLAAGCFLLGLLLYSAIVRAEYPQIGSNFVPSVLCVALALWLVAKLRARKPAQESDTH
ncbi:YijD family membrane protein [Dickeya lacustris]|uniref:YijD family membrane protein n=1 Tax=Dickeya lacustris TaxID=2259638 RepID=A0ABY8G3M7_9GAMM|nr:YijD family membrane protein [Dickeya lacustris]WFN54522.1 YijD family membrane protein [Dickeya lacustris]